MTRHEFTKDTRELYTDLVLGLYDSPVFLEDDKITGYLIGFATGNMLDIREAFGDSLVPMMCPDLMDQLEKLPPDDEVEFRITHNGKTIGVVINSEVDW